MLGQVLWQCGAEYYGSFEARHKCRRIILGVLKLLPAGKLRSVLLHSRFFLGVNSNVYFKIGAAEKSLCCHCFA